MRPRCFVGSPLSIGAQRGRYVSDSDWNSMCEAKPLHRECNLPPCRCEALLTEGVASQRHRLRFVMLDGADLPRGRAAPLFWRWGVHRSSGKSRKRKSGGRTGLCPGWAAIDPTMLGTDEWAAHDLINKQSTRTRFGLGTVLQCRPYTTRGINLACLQ